MSKRKIGFICILAVLFFVAVTWTAVASIRVKYAHKDLMRFLRQTEKYSPDKREELVNYFEKSRLDYVKSTKPLLKKPWRSDIRLYCLEPPMVYAIKKTSNEWFVKVCE